MSIRKLLSASLLGLALTGCDSDKAENLNYQIIEPKNKDQKHSEEELKELARIIGIGAVKYNILSQNRLQNITFDWDRMLSFEGNSAPYLMYTTTRGSLSTC